MDFGFNKLLSSFYLICVLICIQTYSGYSSIHSPVKSSSPSQCIFDLAKTPKGKIKIGDWALVIAKEFDPSIDIPSYKKKLQEMANEINRMLSGRTKDMDKFLAVKTFIYEPGPWNDNKPFSYDLNDPFGNILDRQLISTYIDSRKGNCVSMPTLFLALMELVDPNVSFCGVKAPLHLFCRLKDKQTGDVWNVETTNGGNPARNQWYIDQMEISDLALKNNLYLRDLSKKEFIAELISPLIAKERRAGNFEKALKYTEFVLKLSPESDLGLISKGALLAEIGYKLKTSEKYSKAVENKVADYENLSHSYIDKAISLGWRQQSREIRERYLESVKSNIN